MRCKDDFRERVRTRKATFGLFYDKNLEIKRKTYIPSCFIDEKVFDKVEHIVLLNIPHGKDLDNNDIQFLKNLY